MKLALAVTCSVLLLSYSNLTISLTGGEPKKGQPSSAPRELKSTIEGTVADPDGNRVKLDLGVTSKVVWDKNAYRFTYVIHVGRTQTTPLSLCKGQNIQAFPVLVWESAESASYNKSLTGQKVTFVDSERDVTVLFNAAHYEISRKLLKVMIGESVIASTTAPAYVAKKVKD